MADKRKIMLLLSPELLESVPPVLATMDGWDMVVKSTGPETDITLMNTEAIAQLLAGVDTCFLATHTDFSADNRALEYAQGQSVGLACVKAGVRHVILSGHQSCERTIGIPARHYDSKAEIYQFMRFELKLPITMVSIPPLYEMFYNFLCPTLNNKDQFQIEFPSVGPAPLDFIARSDIGACLIPIIENPSVFMYKTVALCGEKLIGKMVTQILNEELGDDMRFIQRQVTVQEVREKKYAGSIDLANMFELNSRADIKSSPNGTRELYPHTLDFRQWVRLNASKLRSTFINNQTSPPDVVTVI